MTPDGNNSNPFRLTKTRSPTIRGWYLGVARQLFGDGPGATQRRVATLRAPAYPIVAGVPRNRDAFLRNGLPQSQTGGTALPPDSSRASTEQRPDMSGHCPESIMIVLI